MTVSGALCTLRRWSTAYQGRTSRCGPRAVRRLGRDQRPCPGHAAPATLGVRSDPEVPVPAEPCPFVRDGRLTTAALEILELAARAPSEHNAQPWRWTVGPEHIDLSMDPGRRLVFTDPSGHGALLGCGAALQHLRTGCTARGLPILVRHCPDREDRTLLARVALDPRAELPPAVVEHARAMAATIPVRQTDRRRFSPHGVSPDLVEELASVARVGDAVLHVVAGGARRFLVDAMRESDRVQRCRPGYAAELAQWTSRSAGSRDGIPNSALPESGGPYGDLTLRLFPRGRLRQPHGVLDQQDGSVLLVLASPADDAVSVLRSGEALAAVLLEAARRGLGVTPVSQPFEVEDVRARLRSAITGSHRYPQIVLRVGHPVPGLPAIPQTPRRSVSETVGVVADGATRVP